MILANMQIEVLKNQELMRKVLLAGKDQATSLVRHQVEEEKKLWPRPLRDQVLVKQDPPKNQIGSLFTPQGAEEWPPFGTVLDLGSGLRHDGTEVYWEIQIGDRVMFKRQPDSSLLIDEREGDPHGWKDLLMLDYDNILAILENE